MPYQNLFVHLFPFFPYYFVINKASPFPYYLYFLPPLYPILLSPTCNKSFCSSVYSSRKFSKTIGKAVSWSPCRFARRQTLLLKHSSSVAGVRYLKKSAGKVPSKIKDVGNCFWHPDKLWQWKVNTTASFFLCILETNMMEAKNFPRWSNINRDRVSFNTFFAVYIGFSICATFPDQNLKNS